MDFQWTNVITALAAIGTFAAALVAAFTYRRNAGIERAKWSLSLYEKFYERPDLKFIREIIDSDADHENVIQLVLKCPPEFTDYLNFFEFVAFLERKGQLSREELEALFDYYIKCLKRHPRVLTFIKDNGFEELKKMLDSWK